MKLVDDEEMREDIILSNVSKRLREYCNAEFLALTKRLEGLQQVSAIQDRYSPILPRVFVRALFAGLEEAGASRSQRCEIVSAAELALRDIVDGTLREGNEVLVAEGFMIELPVKLGKIVRSREGARRVTGTSATGAAAGEAGGAGGGGASGGDDGFAGDAGSGGAIAELLQRLVAQTAAMNSLPNLGSLAAGLPAMGGVPSGAAMMPGGQAGLPPELLLAQVLSNPAALAGGMATGVQGGAPIGVPTGAPSNLAAGVAAPAVPQAAAPGTGMFLDANLLDALNRFTATVAAMPAAMPNVGFAVPAVPPANFAPSTASGDA
jgi:hypothetical protein